MAEAWMDGLKFFLLTPEGKEVPIAPVTSTVDLNDMDGYTYIAPDFELTGSFQLNVPLQQKYYPTPLQRAVRNFNKALRQRTKYRYLLQQNKVPPAVKRGDR